MTTLDLPSTSGLMFIIWWWLHVSSENINGSRVGGGCDAIAILGNYVYVATWLLLLYLLV